MCVCRSAEGAPDAVSGAGGLQPGEDGAIVGGPRTPQQIAAQKRLQQTQAQVDEVRPENFSFSSSYTN
jgi:vesicle-associated membrane protein 2